MCRNGRSVKQTLHILYGAVTLTDLKGYLMLQFAWAYRGGRVRESELTHQRFLNRTNKARIALMAVMESADDTVYKCDPPRQVQGETYERLSDFLRGVLQMSFQADNIRLKVLYGRDPNSNCLFPVYECKKMNLPVTFCNSVRVSGYIVRIQ